MQPRQLLLHLADLLLLKVDETLEVVDLGAVLGGRGRAERCFYLHPETVDALTQNEYVSQSSGAGGLVGSMA